MIPFGDDWIDVYKRQVQLYTGFVYRGPDLIRECVEDMKAECPVHR